MGEKKALAIITARGGSKRIPKKNIRDFCGKPIIAYSIEAAIKSGLFEEVMVSTDSMEIAEVAQKYGAEIPFMRSMKNSDDHATTADVLLEVLENYAERGREFDCFCCIYPTAPFLTDTILTDSRKYLEDSSCHAVAAVVRYSYPIQRALSKKNGYAVFREPEMLNKRSQDLEPSYHDAGQFYWAKVESFIETPQFLGNQCKMYELDEMFVQDIDEENDWKLAEMKYRLGTDRDEIK